MEGDEPASEPIGQGSPKRARLEDGPVAMDEDGDDPLCLAERLPYLVGPLQSGEMIVHVMPMVETRGRGAAGDDRPRVRRLVVYMGGESEKLRPVRIPLWCGVAFSNAVLHDAPTSFLTLMMRKDAYNPFMQFLVHHANRPLNEQAQQVVDEFMPVRPVEAAYSHSPVHTEEIDYPDALNAVFVRWIERLRHCPVFVVDPL